ncbi:MAG TPA: hypothetical protein PKD77_01460 [Rudaea sp.]|nr:hypothetical protein [Rudaea sp.]
MRRLVFVFTLALVGCATPYKPSGLMGGFHDTQLAEDVFSVTFKGNGYTSDDRARDFMLLRCADLTLAHGAKFFRLVGSADDSRNGAMAMANGNTAFAAPIHFPSESATIQIRATREGPQDYDAAIIAKSMRETYGIK